MLSLDLSLQRTGFGLRAHAELPTPGVTAIFGRSGAGKSTLVQAVAGLGPAQGRIELDGNVLLDSAKGINVPAEQRRIGCVFQDARLFPHLDVRGNLDFGWRRHRGTVVIPRDEVIELLGLEGLLERRAHQLSGGERQRVALGRALLCQPRLLILDEPLASLDVERREELLPYFERLRDRLRIPMLYVSHQYDEVLRLAAQLLVLENGAVVGCDTPAALSLDPALRSRIAAASVGTVVDTTVRDRDPATGLVTVPCGEQTLRLAGCDAPCGSALRLLLPAHEVILAIEPVQGLSVRNCLAGTVESIQSASDGLALVVVDVDGTRIQARITAAAVAELNLQSGQPVWALIKAASFVPRPFRSDTTAN